MDTVTNFIGDVFDQGGKYASQLDETSWLVLAMISVVVGLMLLKGNNIRGA
ncbi:MAG: hypothetical protein AAF456_06425 [Planctomycetota bacterium]